MKYLFFLWSIFLLCNSAFAEKTYPYYAEGTLKSIEATEEATMYSIVDLQTNAVVNIEEPKTMFRGNENRFQAGESVMYSVDSVDGELVYLLNDHARISSLVWWILAFILITMIITKGKSLGALVGLLISGIILINGVLPALKNGLDPLLVCTVAALCISLVSLYASHGFRKSTTIVLISVWITLAICFVLAILAIDTVHLFGFGEETASILVMNGEYFDFKGILLGGILLGSIGIVDDVISTQIESLLQIKESSPSISGNELWKRGIAIGNEHIFSMINTLMLVYFSASLCGMLLLVSANAENGMLINSEMFSEEVMRTIIGSLGIVLSVPIATGLGVWAIQRKII